MEIVLAQQLSGTRNGKDWPAPGTQLELPAAEAEAMVANGSAYAVDDERVAHIGNGNGGAPLSDEILAGAPTARDWTEGQQDTNLARARALAVDERDTREVTRAAAERAGLDDEHTVPGRGAGPVVGDDAPNPTDVSAQNAEAPVAGRPDDGAKLVESATANRGTLESATADPDSSTERATVDTKPAGRKTSTTGSAKSDTSGS